MRAMNLTPSQRKGRGIDELNDDVGSHALNVAVAPLFERVSGCGAAALFRRTLVRAAGRVRFLLIGRSVGDVNAPAIRLPARDAGSEILVGVGDAPVVLFIQFVLHEI